MKKTEVAKLFSVMMLAWPNSKMFEGGIEALGPTIRLWAKCTPEVDFPTAQQAAVRLCRESKFPPTIAEFLEKTGEIRTETDREMRDALVDMRSAYLAEGGLEEFYAGLPEGSRVKAAIDKMGGPGALIIGAGTPSARWNVAGFERAYRLAAPGAADSALPAPGRALL